MQELNMKDSLDANLVQMSTNYCLVYVAFSTALFYRLSTHFLPMYIPFSVVEKNKQWMFKNICNSFLHSSISSVWIAFCLWNYPAHRYDLINVYSNQSYLLICFSVGYFLYDLLDMYWNDRDNSLHLLVHHLVVIGVFGVALYSRFYLGYAMVGLLVEVNSVFLHVRTLMRLSARAASYPRVYRTVCILNFGTFIVFRLYLLAYLTLWLLRHRASLHPNLFLFTLPCLATINAMSWLLFAKLAVEDFAARLILAGRLLGAARLVRHLEAQAALAERRCSEDQSKAESPHFLEKDPYCTKVGNTHAEEELCFTKKGESSLSNKGELKSFKEDSHLIHGDKGSSIPSRRQRHGTEAAERIVTEDRLERNLAPSGSKSKKCDKECGESDSSSGEKRKELNVDSVSHSGRESEKDLKVSSADENVSDLDNDKRKNETSDREILQDLNIMGRGSKKDSLVSDSQGSCDRLLFASELELTKGTGETNLSHRVSTGESLPRTSCSDFLETELVCQSKVKAS